jgi:hypothetical protein
MELPENAGKPWAPAEEAELVRAFEAGATISQLARQHGRTRQAIQGRLYRLGKVPEWRLTAPPDRAADRAGVRPVTPAECASVAAPAQVRLDGLNAAARALVRADFSPDELPTILRAEIASLQRDSGREVAFRDGTGGVWFTFNTRRPCGYATVRKPDQVRFLSGEIDGVWMVVNLHKPGTYRHENAQVAAALRALAEVVEGAEVPLADHDMQLPVGG